MHGFEHNDDSIGSNLLNYTCKAMIYRIMGEISCQLVILIIYII